MAKEDLSLESEATEDELYSGFELGMFRVAMLRSPSEKRAVAIYSPDVDLPTILREVKNIPALPEDIERFLADLLTIRRNRSASHFEREPSSDETYAKIIKEGAARIFDAFEKAGLDVVSETTIEPYMPDELKVSFKLPSSSSEKLPNEALISSAKMEIFGLLKAPPSGKDWTWEKYVAQIKNKPLNPDWLRELEEACIDVAKGRLSIFKRTYRSNYTGKTYQPITYRALLAETRVPANRSYTVTIHFIETSAPDAEIPQIDEALVFVIAAFNEDSEVIFQGIQRRPSRNS
jgi:hypothetical protein